MRYLLAALVLALAGASPAAAEWREARTNHFTIYSEQDAKKLEAFATKLERYDAAMRHFRRLGDVELGPANRLTVYVVSNVAAVQKLFGDRSGMVNGFYIPRASGSIAIIPQRLSSGGKWDLDPEEVLLHEYAHHFLYQNYIGVYPAWFIEGFAEFHSTAKYEKDGAVGIGMPAMHRALGLTLIKPMPMEKMLSSSVNELNGLETETLYGRGWLLTHYLTFDPSRAGQLSNYLQLINQGKTSIDAAKETFGDLSALSKDLDAYGARKRMNYLSIPPQPVGPVVLRTLGAGEDAMMEAKVRSRLGVTKEKAKLLVVEMRRLAAPFPDDPAVQATLAEAEFDAGNHKEAEAAADRALKADPKYMDALIYKAMAAMALADKSTDAGVWRRVRHLIANANRVDPDHAGPLLLYYNSFEQQGIKPTANSVVGLNRAFELAPYDRDLRMQVGRQYLTDGKAKEARAALAPVSFDPHAGTLGDFVNKVVARIDADGAAAGLKAWDDLVAAEEEKEKKKATEAGEAKKDDKAGIRRLSASTPYLPPASFSSNAALRSNP